VSRGVVPPGKSEFKGECKCTVQNAVRAGNTVTHQEDGQNVLFVDGHVGFEKRPFCGVNDDNIYTSWDGGDIRIGSPPIIGRSKPQDRLDSLLVHDGP